MKIRKQKMIEAIDKIVADYDKRTAAWDKATVQWQKERVAAWKRDEWPKWVKLRDLISGSTRTKGPVLDADVAAIFGVNRYNERVNPPAYHPDLSPSGPIKLADGSTVSKPYGVDVVQMKAMRRLLEAVVDDVVTDTQLSKLGVKNVTTIFRAAAELGGLVA